MTAGRVVVAAAGIGAIVLVVLSRPGAVTTPSPSSPSRYECLAALTEFQQAVYASALNDSGYIDYESPLSPERAYGLAGIPLNERGEAGLRSDADDVRYDAVQAAERERRYGHLSAADRASIPVTYQEVRHREGERRERSRAILEACVTD